MAEEKIHQLLLVRDPPINGIIGTSGKFPDVGIVTLELPWKNNFRNISCIPLGEFPMWFGHSNRFGNNRWHIEVPKRDGVLIHRGVYLSHTEGCILVGTKIQLYKPKKDGDRVEYMIQGSETGYPVLLEYLAKKRWELKVEAGH